MVSLKILSGLCLLQVQHVLAIDRVCLRWPYAELLPLKHYPPAESYCSHHYPLPPATVTRTVTQPTTAFVTVSKPARTVTITTRTATSTIYTTAIVATLPSTTTTATVTAFTTEQETVTVSSGTVTAYTTVDSGLTRRNQQKHHDFREDLLPRLAACRRDMLKTACSCIEVHPPTHTISATAKCTHTSYKTVCATKTVSVIGTVTTKNVSTSTISTASTTTTSILGVNTELEVKSDTTSIDSISTLSTVFVTEAPTAATTTASVTSFSEIDVAFTTTLPTTSMHTVIVPLATTTVSSTNTYSRVYGPVERMRLCIDGYSQDIPAGTPHTARAAICAAFCDRTPGCKTVGMNWFPACGANGESVYCIASADAWAGTGTMECGIGTGYNGCAIYQDGTVYEYVT
ncbi:hypothetical protein M440DRAFT_1470101 [Trichoderma longibrachiatum ATCC 18648]|uniref:Apple domain-containing protein n=1 Tax=Trichoderma longibrachiatum ATCC 18648 TaxID=983965 RepID=A0A2T4C693_TRILO|nr:hypothetical protein M440DRAFT_1470101 [Trichoderma longibrachiatum ATCC 18648]